MGGNPLALVGNAHDFLGDIFWRQNEIDAPTVNGALGHVGLARGIQFLCDGNVAHLLDAAQCYSCVTIVA